MDEKINTPWRITKATTTPDGLMVWQATTTKFSRDVQRDYVTRQFYEGAIKRFESKATPSPFFSVAHYPAEKSCVCGHEFSSYDTYVCPQCNKERLLAGVTTSIWIDGEQPKAKGVFYPTALGKSVFTACVEDQKSSRPDNERVRISMGFYPDPDGVVTKSDGRDFLSGWIEHFAATRVPVIPDTELKAELMEKSLSIKTKFDDAAAIVPKALADELVDLERRRRIGKSATDDEIIIKSQKNPVEVAQVEVLPEQVKLQAEMAESSLKVADSKAKNKKKPGKDEEKNKDAASEEKSYLSNLEIESSVLEDAAATLGIVQKAILAPGTDKQEVLARAANLIQSISEFAQAAQQSPTPGDKPGEVGTAPSDISQATNSQAKVASPTPNQSSADASLATTAQAGLANQQPATMQDPNKTDETGLAAAVAPVASGVTPDPMVDMLANQISTLSEEQKMSLAQRLGGSAQPQESLPVDGEAPSSPADDAADAEQAPGAAEGEEDTGGDDGLSEEDQAAMDELMNLKDEEEPGAAETLEGAEPTADEETPASDEGEDTSEKPEDEEESSEGEEETSDDAGADEQADASSDADAESEETGEAGAEEQPADTEEDAPADDKPAETKAPPKKKLTFSKKSLTDTDLKRAETVQYLKSMTFKSKPRQPLLSRKSEPIVIDRQERENPDIDNFETAPRARKIETEKSPIATSTKGNSLDDKLPSSWTSMGTKFMSSEGALGRIAEIGQDGPIPTGRYIVTRYRGDDEGLAHPKPLIASDINEAIQYANVWLSGQEASRRAEEPVSGIPVAHTVVAHVESPVIDATAVGVKSRAELDATVKSEGVHPVAAFLGRWSKQVQDVVSADDGTYTRLQKREMVQKALDEFGNEIVNMIDDHTPIASADVEMVVKAAVQDAVDRVQAQNAQQIATLEAKVKSLMEQTVQGAVAQQLVNKSGGAPRRKSLSAVRPQSGSEAVLKSGTAFPVLSGDTAEQVKYKASDVVRVAMGTTVRY